LHHLNDLIAIILVLVMVYSTLIGFFQIDLQESMKNYIKIGQKEAENKAIINNLDLGVVVERRGVNQSESKPPSWSFSNKFFNKMVGFRDPLTNSIEQPVFKKKREEGQKREREEETKE
jgi:hypothetical protein